MITEATFGAFATSAAAVLTAFLYFESVNLPFLACRTMGLVPLACTGNGFCKVSVACWLFVPGSERLSLVLSPSRWETRTTAIVPTSHTARTSQRCLAQNRPVPYSNPVISHPRS